MKKYFKVLCLVPVLAMLSSCMGEEPNDIAYITAIGIDKSDNGFLYTIQFANPTKISGGAAEEGGSGGNIVENITVKAPTLYKGVSNAEAIVSKDLSLSHAKIAVISEETAKDGIEGLINSIARNNDIRPDIYIAVAENANEYLLAVRPVIELNPVKYYSLTYKSKKGEAIPQSNALDIYSSYKSGDRDIALPLAGVAQTEEKSNKTDAGTGSENNKNELPGKNYKNDEAEMVESEFEYGTRAYYPGQAGVQIKNRSEALGMAVFKGDRYIGRMRSDAAEIYNILNGKARGSKATFYNGEKEPVTARLEQKKKPIYEIDIKNKSVKVKIKLEAELLSEVGDYNHISEDERDAKNGSMISNAAEDFIDKAYGEMNVDLLGIKGRLKRFFTTNGEYNEYIKNFEPKEWNFEVETDLTVKRTGMTTDLE